MGTWTPSGPYGSRAEKIPKCPCSIGMGIQCNGKAHFDTKLKFVFDTEYVVAFRYR